MSILPHLPPLPELLGAPHSLPFLMIVAVMSGIAVLVILGIYWLGRSHIEDEPGSDTPGAGGEQFNETEPEQRGRFIRDTIEQLNSIAVALRDDNSEAEHAPGQEALSKTRPRPPSGKRRSVTYDMALAQLAAKMHKLTEYANRIQNELLVIERNAMASPPPSASIAANRHYLSFTLCDEHFAVSTLNIHSVVEATQLITEPSVPSKTRKAIRLRGALVPVIDLGVRLGWPPLVLDRSSRIVILEVTHADRLQLIGVVVDSIGKLLKIAPAEIKPPAQHDTRIRNDFSLGTIWADERTATLLDIGQVLLVHEPAKLAPTTQAAEQENSRK